MSYNEVLLQSYGSNDNFLFTRLAAKSVEIWSKLRAIGGDCWLASHLTAMPSALFIGAAWERAEFYDGLCLLVTEICYRKDVFVFDSTLQLPKDIGLIGFASMVLHEWPEGVWKMLKIKNLRCSVQRAVHTRQLAYEGYGNPPEAIQLKSINIGDKPAADQVFVKWIAAPINPADLNQIQGVYPVKPTLPAVGGNEGFGKVISVGSNVKSVKEGDHVIPNKSGLGTWRELGLHSETDVFLIDNELPLEYAAVFQVNPPTAYRMLKDFIHLKKGDTVVQNGANSAVGKQVIQICRILGIKSVNVVRNRDNLEDLVKELKDLGADDVITQEELYGRKKKFPGVKLALNCVGGRSSLFLASLLDHGGCMVTYGGMSKQPVDCPTGPLIFKDISLRGFWMSRWYDIQKTPEKRQEMYKELAEWMKSGEMKKQAFVNNRLEDHARAIEDAQNKHEKKQLFLLD